jgi:lipoyl(octanoyl) transferase
MMNCAAHAPRFRRRTPTHTGARTAAGAVCAPYHLRVTALGTERLPVVDLGAMPYAEAFERQTAEHEAVLALRDERPLDDPHARLGSLLLVEHDPPVITVSRRPDAARHLLASEAHLRALGVEVQPTDRGGDITYHGPGQLVAYPIIDLNRVGLRLHDYMRLLEQAVIDTCDRLGVRTARDDTATGVWVPGDERHPGGAKICAIGVRVRRWVTMHGLALNVATNLEHFKLIVPCGLAGRPVTSIAEQLARGNGHDRHEPISLDRVKPVLAAALAERLSEAASESSRRRAN